MNDKTKGVLAYLGIAFGMAWVLWEIPLRLGLSPRSPFFQLAALPGAFAPAVATVVVRKWVTAHAASNAIGGSLTTLLFAGGPDQIFVTYLGLLGWLPLRALCAWIVFSGQLRRGGMER